MKQFVNEVFSLEIDPNTGKDPAVIISFYENGDLLVCQAKPFALEAEHVLSSAFCIDDASLLNKLVAIVKKAGNDLAEAPTDLLIDGYGGSQYVLSINGRLYNGDYAYTDMTRFQGTGNDPASSKTKARYSNIVISFMSGFSKTLFGSKAMVAQLTSVKEDGYLRPASRLLIYRANEDSNGAFIPVSSLDEAIKAGAKKAYGSTGLPLGKLYNDAFVLLRQKLLPLLKSSHSQAVFDKEHEALSDELTGLGLTYEEAASWIDFSYLYIVLLEEDIIKEDEVALLHSTIEPFALANLYKEANKSNYLLYQKEFREEWGHLNVSPLYLYLIGVYSDVHPKVGTTVGKA